MQSLKPTWPLPLLMTFSAEILPQLWVCAAASRARGAPVIGLPALPQSRFRRMGLRWSLPRAFRDRIAEGQFLLPRLRSRAQDSAAAMP